MHAHIGHVGSGTSVSGVVNNGIRQSELDGVSSHDPLIHVSSRFIEISKQVNLHIFHLNFQFKAHAFKILFSFIHIV